MPKKIVFAYITAKNLTEAKKIGAILVKERLCACVNIFPVMHSIYCWNGKINSDKEAVLIAKTTSKMFARLSARVKQLHSYECPCILQLEIKAGNKEYISWLESNIR